MRGQFEYKELFNPTMSAYAGSYVFKKGVEIEAYSDQNAYASWAKIRFTPDFQPQISLAKMDEGAILLGYDNTLQPVFEGYVAKPYNSGGYVNEITMKDDAILLEDTFITQTFQGATPQEIITYALGQAGISNYKLSSKPYAPRKIVPIFRKSVIAVIKELHALWSTEELFFFSDGVFYWGEKPEQGQVYNFEYAKNIISLQRPLNMWELETVSMPFIKHSQKLNINHPKVTGQFEIKKVHFDTRDTGFIRTRIYF